MSVAKKPTKPAKKSVLVIAIQPVKAPAKGAKKEKKNGRR